MSARYRSISTSRVWSSALRDGSPPAPPRVEHFAGPRDEQARPRRQGPQRFGFLGILDEEGVADERLDDRTEPVPGPRARAEPVDERGPSLDVQSAPIEGEDGGAGQVI